MQICENVVGRLEIYRWRDLLHESRLSFVKREWLSLGIRIFALTFIDIYQLYWRRKKKSFGEISPEINSAQLNRSNWTIAKVQQWVNV